MAEGEEDVKLGWSRKDLRAGDVGFHSIEGAAF
jgi:hypothetical protein